MRLFIVLRMLVGVCVALRMLALAQGAAGARPLRRYYTEFEVRGCNASTFNTDMHAFLATVCAALPAGACALAANATVFV